MEGGKPGGMEPGFGNDDRWTSSTSKINDSPEWESSEKESYTSFFILPEFDFPISDRIRSNAAKSCPIHRRMREERKIVRLFIHRNLGREMKSKALGENNRGHSSELKA